MTGRIGSYHVGIDLGGTNLKFALLDEKGYMVEHATVPTWSDEGHDAVVDRMIVHARELAAAAPGGLVASIGVGVPGVLDMDAGVTTFLPNLMGGWDGVAVGPRIGEATGIPTFLINDVRAFTLAELELGAAKGAQSAIAFAVGTGIGGGIVSHGRVHFGVGGAAGELGHQTVDPTGPECGCGNRGCAEAYASGPAIIREANRRLAEGASTVLRDMTGDDPNRMTPALVEEAATAGDAIATEVLEHAGYYFAIAVANSIAAFAPEVVVLGGGVIKPGGVFWRVIETTARSRCHVTDIDRIAFKPAALGYDAGVIGAALWGMKAVQS